MSFYPSSYTVEHFHADDGNLLSGGTLEYYIAGTTTPVTVYTDSVGTEAGATITLNARGEPEVSGNTIIIWLSASVDYKVIGKNASGGIEWTIDNLTSSSAGNTNTAVAQADYIQWPFITVNGSDTNHDIDFSAGRVADSTAASMLILESVMTKQIDSAWTVGNNAGGLFSGTAANSTTYYCFLIQNDTDETIDCGFDTSSTAANIPAGYTKYRRIAQFDTDGSANIDSTSIVPLLNAEIAKRGENNGTCPLNESGLVPLSNLSQNIDQMKTDLDAAEAAIVSNDSDISSLQSGKANTSGTYASLRAQATTKSDVGLGNVANYGVSTSVSNSSTTTYATASAVKTAYDEANKALSKTTLWTGSTTGDISLAQAYTNFRFLVIVSGESDWGSSLVIETGSIAKAWERSGSKYVHSVGSDGYIEILQSGSSSTYFNMGASLRGVITAVYGVGDF